MTYRGRIKNGVAVLDSPADLPDGTAVRIDVIPEAADFWQSKSLADLASEQRVLPLQSADALAGDWPDEDSIDEFLALLRKVRC
jgi:hypothetical protein